jgi:hypothetical protein
MVVNAVGGPAVSCSRASGERGGVVLLVAILDGIRVGSRRCGEEEEG